MAESLEVKIINLEGYVQGVLTKFPKKDAEKMAKDGFVKILGPEKLNKKAPKASSKGANSRKKEEE